MSIIFIILFDVKIKQATTMEENKFYYGWFSYGMKIIPNYCNSKGYDTYEEAVKACKRYFNMFHPSAQLCIFTKDKVFGNYLSLWED